MAAMLPMAMFGLEVPAGDVAIAGKPEIPSAYRITMAAIDPTAEPEGDEGQLPRATLKVIRQPLLDSFDDDEFSEDSEDFDPDEMEALLAEGEDEEDSEDDDDEEVNGGPSDRAKNRKAQEDAIRADIKKQLAESGMDLDDESLPNGTNGVSKSAKAKGKMPASDEDEDDDEEDIDSDSEEGAEIEEFVICTLDPSKNYQQPLDLTIGEDERVWFKVTGTHTIYLTGNFVEPLDKSSDIFDPDSDEDEEYDLEPDEDELDLYDEESEDELDELEDARITELLDEAEDEPPKLVKAGKGDKKANKNKRAASESADEEDVEAATLDEMITKAKESAAPAVNGEQKLSKKQLKKLKKNDGNATAAPAAAKVEDLKDGSATKSDKKVSFAKQLEQGPTPTKDKPAEADKAKASLGARVVQGVTVDDRKIGSGQAAKNGDRIGMRYIGKLKDGKVFDSNKKGKPFSFKLGIGEVIKGWDIGVQGMQVGGERRITIPAHLAYGSKRTGDIPPNSTLIFDIKMMEIGKGK